MIQPLHPSSAYITADTTCCTEITLWEYLNLALRIGNRRQLKVCFCKNTSFCRSMPNPEYFKLCVYWKYTKCMCNWWRYLILTIINWDGACLSLNQAKFIQRIYLKFCTEVADIPRSNIGQLTFRFFSSSQDRGRFMTSLPWPWYYRFMTSLPKSRWLYIFNYKILFNMAIEFG